MPAPSTNEAPDAIKARGAFYTPPDIARFLSDWAIRDGGDRVLEPSCGDGVFVAAAVDRLKRLGSGDAQLFGVELEPLEAEKARALAPGADIRTASFFDVLAGDVGTIDAVVGNPPYIRYHQWSGESRSGGIARAAELGVELSSLASSWAPFVVHGSSFLGPTGRLALVLPAELLHTDYAGQVRDFLLRRFSSVVIIAFDHLVFADAQVDAVLLLASGDDESGLRVVRVRDEHALAELSTVAMGNGTGPNGHVPDHRWSVAVDADAAALYAGLVACGRYRRLGDIASVDIGFVSGANSYFVLDADEVRQHDLPDEALTPTIERPSDLRGLTVRPDATRFLFRPDEATADLPEVSHYLEHGVELGIHTRYKPRHRRPWYRVPLPHQVGNLLLTYMSHHTPHLVVSGSVRTSNLVHSVRLREGAGVDPRVLAAWSLGSVWALSAEVEGRAYGGGVLKLETKEAERVLVPELPEPERGELIQLFPQLDDLVRNGRRREATAIIDQLLRVPSRIGEAAASFRARRQGRGARRRPAGA